MPTPAPFQAIRQGSSVATGPERSSRLTTRSCARPCPWVGCRHHLLIEVMQSNGRWREPPSIVLNGWSRSASTRGRRPGLPSNAAELLVRTWIDEAVELISRLPYTCSLDWIDDTGHEPTPENVVAWLLGVSEQAINNEKRRALSHLRDEVGEMFDELVVAPQDALDLRSDHSSIDIATSRHHSHEDEDRDQ